MALLKYQRRHYGDYDTGSEWGDSLSGPEHHQVAVIKGSSTRWSSGPSADGVHRCETAESFKSIEWADNSDPIYEWDRTLHYTADAAYQTFGEVLLFTSRDSFDRPSPSLCKRFRGLAQQWSQDTVFCSSSHDIVMHWAYQQVIGLGSQVVPLIYEEMTAGALHWTWALSAILGEDPAANTDSPRDATDVWMKWIEDRYSVSQLSALR
jgi:hypothetical protein